MDFIEKNSIRPSGFRSPDVKEKTVQFQWGEQHKGNGRFDPCPLHFQWVVRSTDRTLDFYSNNGGSIPSRPTFAGLV